jgi:hypothetical protein
VLGAMQAWLTAVIRYQSRGSDRRAVSASGESCRMSSGQSTLRFRDLLTAEVAQHRLSFRLYSRNHSRITADSTTAD